MKSFFHFCEVCVEWLNIGFFLAETAKTPENNNEQPTPVEQPESVTPIAESPVAEVVTDGENPVTNPQTEVEPEAATPDEGKFSKSTQFCC